jgi:hypothetical protein
MVETNQLPPEALRLEQAPRPAGSDRLAKYQKISVGVLPESLASLTPNLNNFLSENKNLCAKYIIKLELYLYNCKKTKKLGFI